MPSVVICSILEHKLFGGFSGSALKTSVTDTALITQLEYISRATRGVSFSLIHFTLVLSVLFSNSYRQYRSSMKYFFLTQWPIWTLTGRGPNGKDTVVFTVKPRWIRRIRVPILMFSVEYFGTMILMSFDNLSLWDMFVSVFIRNSFSDFTIAPSGITTSAPKENAKLHSFLVDNSFSFFVPSVYCCSFDVLFSKTNDLILMCSSRWTSTISPTGLWQKYRKFCGILNLNKGLIKKNFIGNPASLRYNSHTCRSISVFISISLSELVDSIPEEKIQTVDFFKNKLSACKTEFKLWSNYVK